MNARKRIGIALGLGVIALAIGSIALGAIPGADGVIHGCYDKQSGQLRVTDSATNTPKGCSSKEAALTWNQQGPQGIQGPQGAPGVTRVYTEDNIALKKLPAGQSIEVRSIALPPGNYAITAKVEVMPDGFGVGPATVSCNLTLSTATWGVSDWGKGAVYSVASGNVIESTLAMQLASGNANEPLKASINCLSPVPAQTSFARITAMKVDTID